jgi:DNA polymerase alpha-associated DNA helicase A
VDEITLAVKLDKEMCQLLDKGLLRVETVDGAQGAEADYVILSMVRCQPPSGLGFLNKPNRLCVAFSRAKRLLFVIGHAGTFQNSENILIKNLLGVRSRFMVHLLA